MEDNFLKYKMEKFNEKLDFPFIGKIVETSNERFRYLLNENSEFRFYNLLLTEERGFHTSYIKYIEFDGVYFRIKTRNSIYVVELISIIGDRNPLEIGLLFELSDEDLETIERYLDNYY